MQVRMLIDVSGTFHNIDAGVRRGDVVDVDDATGARYMQHGIAEHFDTDTGGEESAVLDTAGAESAVVPPKRRGGRPKKQPDWHDEKAPGWSEGNPQQ